MSRVGRCVIRLVGGVVTVVIFTVAPGFAQAPPASVDAGGRAPVMTFGPDGITLEQAVTIAIKNDPALRSAEYASQRLLGARQEQRGLFDITLQVNAAFEYRQQELSETRKADELRKRNNAKSQANSLTAESTLLAQQVSLLQQLSATSPGSPLVRQLLVFSPSLYNEIRTLDTMILSPSTPAAARAELTRLRAETLQQWLVNSNAQKGQIDAARLEAQTRVTNLGEAPVDEFFRSGSFSMQLSKVFRSGVSVAPFVDGSIDTTSFVGKPISATFGGKGVEDQEKVRAGINLTLPVLRGRGATVFAAGERAAVAQAEAGQLRFEHQASASALNTIRAYWALRAAEDSLDAQRRSLELQSQVVGITQALIQAGEMPAMELARAQAGEARTRAAAKSAERRLIEARVGLALAMGLGATSDDASLPTASSAFPATAAVAPAAPLAPPRLAADAVGRRRDLQAARKAEEASGILARAAELSTRPRLDVTAEAYYTALGERNFQRVVDRFVGPSVSVGLEFEKPFGNNTLQGQKVQRQADRRQQMLAAGDLERQIQLNVVRAATAVQQAVEQAREANTAVEHYRKSVEAELTRFKVGESTLINAIVTERQATEAELSAIAANQQLATLIAELRYETGTLLDGTTVSAPALVSLPQVGGR